MMTLNLIQSCIIIPLGGGEYFCFDFSCEERTLSYHMKMIR